MDNTSVASLFYQGMYTKFKDTKTVAGYTDFGRPISSFQKISDKKIACSNDAGALKIVLKFLSCLWR